MQGHADHVERQRVKTKAAVQRVAEFEPRKAEAEGGALRDEGPAGRGAVNARQPDLAVIVGDERLREHRPVGNHAQGREHGQRRQHLSHAVLILYTRAGRPAAGIVGLGFNAARSNRPATPGMASRKQISYRDAGVNIDEADRAVSLIKKHARPTFTPGVLTDIGSFGAGFQITGFKQPVLISSADGVGTKLKIAFLTGRHDTIGEDLVNHCTNDIAVQGAKPLFFLDYFAVGRLRADVAGQVIAGVARGCRRNNCALIGGETAEMPGLYSRANTIWRASSWAWWSAAPCSPEATIHAGDVLLGLPSNGLHTNGYSLARKLLFEVAGIRARSQAAIRPEADHRRRTAEGPRQLSASHSRAAGRGSSERRGAHHRRRHHR